MTTRLHLRCDGCFAETHTERIHKRFAGSHGSYGFGSWQMPDIDGIVAAIGWVWSDPHTACTYCPECWKQIEAGSDEVVLAPST